VIFEQSPMFPDGEIAGRVMVAGVLMEQAAFCEAEGDRKMAQVTRIECDCRIGEKATPEELFSLHYGAHEEACSLYRRSGDPVDHKWDLEARREILAR